MKTNEQHLQSALTAKGINITGEEVRTILDEVVELAAASGTSLQDAYECGAIFWEEEYADKTQEEDTEQVHIPADGEIDSLLFALFGLPGEGSYYYLDVGEDPRAELDQVALFIKDSDHEDVGEIIWDTRRNRMVQVFYTD